MSGSSLDWEDPLEKGMTTHSNIPAWRIPMDRTAWRAIVHRVSKSWTHTTEVIQHTPTPEKPNPPIQTTFILQMLTAFHGIASMSYYANQV